MSVPESIQPQGEHFYRVQVHGYVFPELPPGTPLDRVKERAREMVAEGELDITYEIIEGASFGG